MVEDICKNIWKDFIQNFGRRYMQGILCGKKIKGSELFKKSTYSLF